MSNRWKIIFIVTAFNLLFEYSLRGLNNLKAQPFLPIILFSIYFTLFIMVEDLIVRHKLRDYHLMILAFCYGTIYCAFTSGLTFINPTFLGVAWGPLLYVNLVWWGALQAVLAFYLANLISPRDWNHPRMSRFGWVVCLVVNLLAILLFQKSGLIPHGTPVGRLTIWVIVIVSGLLFIRSVKRNKSIHNPVFVKVRFLNILSVVTTFLFLFSAVFLVSDPILANTSHVNKTSLQIIGPYTLILSIILLIYRVRSEKEISV